MASIQYHTMSTTKVKTVAQNRNLIKVRSKYSNRHRLKINKKRTVFVNQGITFIKAFR